MLERVNFVRSLAVLGCYLEALHALLIQVHRTSAIKGSLTFHRRMAIWQSVIFFTVFIVLLELIQSNDLPEFALSSHDSFRLNRLRFLVRVDRSNRIVVYLIELEVVKEIRGDHALHTAISH